MTISFPVTKDIIDSIRSAIGRDTKWYFVSHYDTCSGCGLDPVTNTSTNSFCVICSGLYYIPIMEYENIEAHVYWEGSEQLNWYSGGQVIEGDCRLQIEFTPDNLEIVNKSKWVEVDGKELEVKKVIYRGVPEINRIITFLKEV